MPAYKSEGFIQRSVDSVVAQTYKNWELLIIADDEQDYSRIVTKHPSIKFLTTGKTGSGPQHARNIALDNASGDLIYTLDSDDEFMPEKLEIMNPKVLEYGFATSAFHRTTYSGSSEEYIDTPTIEFESKPVRVDEFFSVNFSTNSIIGLDRRKISSRYPEYIGYLEDLIFSVSCYDYVERCYHFTDKLHKWVHRSESLSNCKAAPKNFIAAKKLVLEKIDNGTINLKNPESLHSLRAFIQMSLECEKVFDKQIENNVEYIDFVDIFIEQISRLYPDKIYEYKGRKYINGNN
jgi:glycosyltransferase involved in cell wall biosynthesis